MHSESIALLTVIALLILALLDWLGGQARGAEGTHMQADAFPWTSGAWNPIVIVKIFFSPAKSGAAG